MDGVGDRSENLGGLAAAEVNLDERHLAARIVVVLSRAPGPWPASAAGGGSATQTRRAYDDSAMMEHYAPLPPLSEHIHLFWYFDGILGTTPRERLLPDGSSNVIIDLGTRSSVITGAHSKYFVIEASIAMHVMGIWFKPGGAFRFMNLPASELRDTHVALDDVWGAFAGDAKGKGRADAGIKVRDH